MAGHTVHPIPINVPESGSVGRRDIRRRKSKETESTESHYAHTDYNIQSTERGRNNGRGKGGAKERVARGNETCSGCGETDGVKNYYCKACKKELNRNRAQKRKDILQEATGGKWWLEQYFDIANSNDGEMWKQRLGRSRVMWHDKERPRQYCINWLYCEDCKSVWEKVWENGRWKIFRYTDVPSINIKRGACPDHV